MFRKLVLLTVSAYWFMGGLEAAANDVAEIESVYNRLKKQGLYTDIQLNKNLLSILDKKKNNVEAGLQELVDSVVDYACQGPHPSLRSTQFVNLFDVLLIVLKKDDRRIEEVAKCMFDYSLLNNHIPSIIELIDSLLKIYKTDHPKIIEMADHLAKSGAAAQWADVRCMATAFLYHKGLLRKEHQFLAEGIDDENPKHIITIFYFIYGPKHERTQTQAIRYIDKISHWCGISDDIEAFLDMNLFERTDPKIQNLAQELYSQSVLSSDIPKCYVETLSRVWGAEDERVNRLQELID